MALTVAQALARIKYSEPSISDSVGLELLNIVHNELYRRLPLKTQVELLAVTQDEEQVAGSANWGDIYWVHYVESVGSRRRLQYASLYEIGDWQYQMMRTGFPQWYYVIYPASGVPTIGLIPKPNRSSSGTGQDMYPRLEVFRSEIEEDLTANGNLPAWVTSVEIYTAGALYHWARLNRHPSFQARLNDYQREWSQVARLVWGRVSEDGIQMAPKMYFPSGW